MSLNAVIVNVTAPFLIELFNCSLHNGLVWKSLTYNSLLYVRPVNFPYPALDWRLAVWPHCG